MIWSRLKNLKCPECNSDLIKSHNGVQEGYACSKGKYTHFFIGIEKFNRVVSDLYNPKIEVVRDNQAELNNLQL